MKSVLAEFPKWEQQMSERQKSIMAAGDEERTTLLVAESGRLRLRGAVGAKRKRIGRGRGAKECIL